MSAPEQQTTPATGAVERIGAPRPGGTSHHNIGQSDAAAERSAHVIRGGAAGGSSRLITEWRGPDGRTYAAFTGYLEKDRRIAELEAEVAALRAALEAGRGVEPRQSEVMSLDGPPGLPAAPGR